MSTRKREYRVECSRAKVSRKYRKGGERRDDRWRAEGRSELRRRRWRWRRVRQMRKRLREGMEGGTRIGRHFPRTKLRSKGCEWWWLMYVRVIYIPLSSCEISSHVLDPGPSRFKGEDGGFSFVPVNVTSPRRRPSFALSALLSKP